MKGVWRCQAVLGGTRNTRLELCHHWQVHNGHPGKPKRIDVRCHRCETRHQHVPNPRDERGRDSRIRYIQFPDQVDVETLIGFVSRRNAHVHTLEFRRANEL